MAALERWRFSLEMRGRPLRLQFSTDKEHKDIIQGPAVRRGQAARGSAVKDMASRQRLGPLGGVWADGGQGGRLRGTGYWRLAEGLAAG